jgi:hypothetical protein
MFCSQLPITARRFNLVADSVGAGMRFCGQFVFIIEAHPLNASKEPCQLRASDGQIEKLHRGRILVLAEGNKIYRPRYRAFLFIFLSRDINLSLFCLNESNIPIIIGLVIYYVI